MERLLSAGWTRTTTKNSIDINIKSYRPLSSGVDGAVYEINHDKRYVVKLMTDKDAFRMELYVGSIDGIRRSGGGVRVHAHASFTTDNNVRYYALLLDHASFGNPDITVVSAKDFLLRNNNYSSQQQRSNTAAFFRLFARKLTAFYRTTQGFHGDLHNQNVVVAVHKKSKLLVNVVIIDYGRFIPFGRRSGVFSNKNNLRTMLDIGHREFQNVTRNQRFTYLGVPRRAYKVTGTRNPSGSNRNLLQSDVYWKRAYNKLVSENPPASLNTITRTIQGLRLMKPNTFNGCSKHTVVELKQMLRERNMKVSGKRAELCARLVE